MSMLTWDDIKRGIFAGESGGDYSALYGYSNRPGARFAGVDVTRMSVDEALQFANPSGPYAQWVKDHVGHVATPMGAYQVVGTTLRDAKHGLGLRGDERMTPELQDRIGRWVYDTQGTRAWAGYDRVAAGDFAGFSPVDDSIVGRDLRMPAPRQEATREDRPMGLLDMITGGARDNAELFDALALGFNSMRLNPDPNIATLVADRRKTRSDERRRNRTAEVLERMAPEAAALVREGLLSPGEALGVARDQEARSLAAQAAEAIARGDYQAAYALSMRLSPTAAGQAVAQLFAPRSAEVTGGGRYTVTYDQAGKPTVTPNQEVIDAEAEIAAANSDRARLDRGLPTTALKAEEDDFAAIDTIDALQDEIGLIIKDFGYKPDTGQFEGPLQIGVGGFIEGALGSVGIGGEGTQETALARQRFDRFRTRLINESLRLNAGVQTEGDAQRAAKELGDARTTEAAYAAIADLMRINQRARQMRERAIVGRRERYKFPGVEIPAAPEAPNLNWRVVP
jgi:hypothetical protein